MKFFKKNDREKDSATKYFEKIILIGFTLLAFRLLFFSNSFHSSLLYIAIPFILSLVLYYMTPHTDGASWKSRFWNNLRHTMIIWLASAIIMMEGYVCIIMAMPLFIFITFCSFLGQYIWEKSKDNYFKAYFIPVIIILSSIEGVTDETTFNRYNEVTYSKIINADIKTLSKRLHKQTNLINDRHWLISIFPMPVNNVEQTEINKGGIRKYDFIYNRWFVTNTHKGSIEVKFDEVSDSSIRTSIEDTSYISNYMKLHGSELKFKKIDNQNTKITLTVKFDRLLDPIWYFEPLERFAVKRSAEYFVNEVLSNKS